MGDNTEEVLTLSGNVTGSVRVVWQSKGRAAVMDGGYGQEDVGRLTFKGGEYRLFNAHYTRHPDGTWKFQPGSVPIRKGNSSFNDAAPPTYMRAMLDAIAEALKGAFTVDKARSANVADVERRIERLTAQVMELEGTLKTVRGELAEARAERALYG